MHLLNFSICLHFTSTDTTSECGDKTSANGAESSNPIKNDSSCNNQKNQKKSGANKKSSKKQNNRKNNVQRNKSGSQLAGQVS